MTKTYATALRSALLGSIAILGMVSCSMMVLKQYPEAPTALFKNAESKDGISAVAQLLSDEESKEYFGVNLPSNGIIAVYLTVRNDSQKDSYVVYADSVKIDKQNGENVINNPANSRMNTGEVVSIISLWLGAKLMSDASVIKENFELKRLRTTTIDPGEKLSGFSYFRRDEEKVVDSLHICFTVANPVINLSFPYCLDATIKG